VYNRQKEERMETATKETIDSVQQLPIKALPDRGLNLDTCKHFGVRVSISEKDGQTIDAIYFPVTDSGTLVGYKKRDLTKPKGHKYHFTFIGSVSVDCDLFGQEQCQAGGKKLIATEGELDAMATWQILKTQFPQANPNVVSIIMGTKNAAKNIAYNEKFCSAFKEKILCFDQDRATDDEKKQGIIKGYDAVTEVCQYDPDWLHTSFSENDPNEMLTQGKSDELYWAIIKHSQKHIPDEVMRGGTIGLDELTKPLEKGIFLPNFPGLMDKMKGLRKGELTLVLAPSGVGKCLGKGTPVMMFNGETKPVEEIEPGELIMGPDSNPRTVKSTTSGHENLYRIRQNKGMDYVVNESHILSLRNSSKDQFHKHGEIWNVSVRDYLNCSKWEQSGYKGYKALVNFEPKEPVWSPYFLGLWLGDGDSSGTTVWTGDREVKEWLENFAIAENSDWREKPGSGCIGFHIANNKGAFSPVREKLTNLGVIHNKHIPHSYKTSSRLERLYLLAGLVDSDGYVNKDRKNTLEITQKNEKLADDICYLCSTLGLLPVKKPKVIENADGEDVTYHRINISGDLTVIPTKIARKQFVKRTQRKELLNTGFQIESLGEGDYYGFEIEENDRRFLLGDCTVTHNTSVMREWDYGLMNSGEKVAKIFLEESVEKTHQGLLALDNDVFLPKFREDPSIVPKEKLQESYDRLINNDRCYFYRHKRGRVDHDSLMKAIRWFATIGGCDYIILDHLTLVFSGSEQKDERKEIDMTLTLLATLAEELKIHLVCVAHIKRMNKTFVKDDTGTEWLWVDQDSARGSGAFEQLSWNIVCLEPEKREDGERGRIRTRLTKNREWGYLGVGDVLKMDSQTGRMVDASEAPEF